MSINIFMKDKLKKIWELIVEGFHECGSFWWITW